MGPTYYYYHPRRGRRSQLTKRTRSRQQSQEPSLPAPLQRLTGVCMGVGVIACVYVCVVLQCCEYVCCVCGITRGLGKALHMCVCICQLSVFV